jgi:hypothetical protein
MELVLRKPKREVKCITDDITFESINACARYYMIDTGYLRSSIIQKRPVNGKVFVFNDDKEDIIKRKYSKVSNAKLEYNGVPLRKWCEENGINFRRIISRRASTGCSIQEAIDYLENVDKEREKNKCWACQKRCCDGCPFLKIEESIENLKTAKGGFKEVWEKDI